MPPGYLVYVSSENLRASPCSFLLLRKASAATTANATLSTSKCKDGKETKESESRARCLRTRWRQYDDDASPLTGVADGIPDGSFETQLPLSYQLEKLLFRACHEGRLPTQSATQATGPFRLFQKEAELGQQKARFHETWGEGAPRGREGGGGAGVRVWKREPRPFLGVRLSFTWAPLDPQGTQSSAWWGHTTLQRG